MRAMFPPEAHPDRVFERAVDRYLKPGAAVLDIGCGRTAPHLTKLIGRADVLYGVDLVDFTVADPRLHLFNTDVCDMPGIPDAAIDVAYSRAVMEHLQDPRRACIEIARTLKPGGVYIFTTPSIYDYGSLIASLVPNRWHGRIVSVTEGRAEEDVFPTVFAANSRRAVSAHAGAAGLTVREFQYLGQYPNYLVFNRMLFWLGSMYQKTIEKFALTQPLQGWIYCVLEKPA
jgi:SAM-dependent methyltransferase